MELNEEWKAFCRKSYNVLKDAFDNKISLEEATAFFEKDDLPISDSIREYIIYVIWEIGGSPGLYEELMELFRSNISKEALIEYCE